LKSKWILEVVAALFVLSVVCLLGAMFVVSVRQENVCWAAGYELPVNYAGECWCFGRDRQPEVVALAALEDGLGD